MVPQSFSALLKLPAVVEGRLGTTDVVPVSFLLPWKKSCFLWVFLIKTTIKKIEFLQVCITEAMGGCCCSSFCGQFLLARVHWVRAQEPLDPSVHGRAKQAPHREFEHSFSTQVCGLVSLTGLPSVKEMYQGKGSPEVVYEGFWTLWKCQGINMGTKWRFARLVLSVLGMSCLMLLLAVLPCCVPCLCHTLYLCCKAALRYLLRVLLVEKKHL